jgi:hypothetical protein
VEQALLVAEAVTEQFDTARRAFGQKLRPEWRDAVAADAKSGTDYATHADAGMALAFAIAE